MHLLVTSDVLCTSMMFDDQIIFSVKKIITAEQNESPLPIVLPPFFCENIRPIIISRSTKHPKHNKNYIKRLDLVDDSQEVFVHVPLRTSALEPQSSSFNP